MEAALIGGKWPAKSGGLRARSSLERVRYSVAAGPPRRAACLASTILRTLQRRAIEGRREECHARRRHDSESPRGDP